MSSAALFDCLPDTDAPSGDAILTGFLRWVESTGLELYPHQEEAVLALMDDQNVILHTPTGSGKSLVATALHFKSLEDHEFYQAKCEHHARFVSTCRSFWERVVIYDIAPLA